MAFNVFLDTNIIVDVLDPLRPFHDDSKILFNFLDQGKFKAFYSESVATTIAYVIRKDYQKNQILEIIGTLNQKIALLSCISSNINNAISKTPPDFEDALLYEIASHHEMDYFITSNTKDFKSIQQERLPVLNARGFNKILRV